MKLNENQSGECPSYFKGCVLQARQGGGRPKGGLSGYGNAAYQLVRHLPDLVQGDVPDPVVDEYWELLEGQDADKIWGWIQRTLPRCAALIPPTSVDSFKEGIQQVLEDGL